ncbi:MAG: MBL fold metallo-hydrolase, partial [Candidatus Hecatellales archaeon]
MVECGGERILLDFGVSFSRKRRFYSEPFLSPRSVESLLEFGLLPGVEGLYRFDEGEPTVSAVFLSHAHLDHSAYISFLKREIPIYCGETTLAILEAVGEIRGKSFEYDFSNLKFSTFRTGSRIRVGCFEVKPVHVDHSIPGAYGFIIHTPEGSLAYTGDFRLHGSKPQLTLDFIAEAAEAKVESFIVEGTNLVDGGVSSEAELEEKLWMVASKVRGLILADFATTDVDRLKSFLSTASKTGRRLALDLKHAYMVEKLSADRRLKLPSLRDSRLAIYRKAKRRYMAFERALMDRY